MMKRWLAGFAVALAAATVSVPALAKDATAHTLVAEGDLVRARAAIVAALGEDLPAEERAAYMELMVLVERWSTSGARPRARVEKEEPVPEGEDWNGSFALAREAVVIGRYANAEARLTALSRSAPDASSRARAEELAMLAHDISARDLAAAQVQAQATATAGSTPEGKSVETKTSEWYGWETLICDGASIVTTPIVIGIGGYVFCAPIVHIANGQPLTGLASVGLRLGAPLGLGFLGAALEASTHSGRCEFGCGFAGAIVGFSVGLVSAIVIDSAVLARKEVKKTQTGSTLVPIGSARGDRVEVGLAGTF